MGSLQRDPSEVEDLIAQMGEVERINFEQFVNLMQQVEARIANQGHQQQIEAEPMYN